MRCTASMRTLVEAHQGAKQQYETVTDRAARRDAKQQLRDAKRSLEASGINAVVNELWGEERYVDGSRVVRGNPYRLRKNRSA